MEYLFEWVLPLWLASWIFIIWQIFVPSIRIIREASPDHVIYRWKVATFLLFSIMAFVTVPFLIWAALIEKYRMAFIYNYVTNMIGAEDEED
jgi:hypothetical protein